MLKWYDIHCLHTLTNIYGSSELPKLIFIYDLVSNIFKKKTILMFYIEMNMPERWTG